MRYRLVGLTGTLAGFERRIVEYAPVVAPLDGATDVLYAAPGLDWTHRSLIALTAADAAAVTPLRRGTHIDEGDTVWMFGGDVLSPRVLVEEVCHKPCEAVSLESRETPWFWIASGTRMEFADVCAELERRATRELQYVLRAAPRDCRYARAGFGILDALPTPMTRQRALDLGLYFKRVGDEEALDWIADEAVYLHRLFASSGGFMEQLRRHDDRVGGKRTAEPRPAQPSPAPRGAASAIPQADAMSTQDLSEVKLVSASVDALYI